MKTPAGYLGHVRDIVRGQCVRDPDVRFDGPDASTRVCLRTDGLYVTCIDRGESAGALRYEAIETHTALGEASEAARTIAGVKLDDAAMRAIGAKVTEAIRRGKAGAR